MSKVYQYDYSGTDSKQEANCKVYFRYLSSSSGIPAKDIEVIKIEEFTSLNETLDWHVAKNNEGLYVAVHHKTWGYNTNSWGAFKHEFRVYFTRKITLALSSTGDGYGQAFISTAQGLQELDGFF